MDILIQGGTVVSAKESKICDIRIRDEKIAEIGESLDPSQAEVIDARGKLIFPGFIDTHTHFDLDAGDFHTADNFETGTKAAIAGGTTTILDFTTQEKGETLMEALNNWHKLADGNASCDYSFHMSITEWNSFVKKELKTMTEEGITSYKLYMAYDNLRISDQEIFEILKEVTKEGGIIGVHCENGDLIKACTKELKDAGEYSVSAHPKSRPDVVEAEAIHRLLTIAKLAKAPINIVHLSTKRGFEVIQRARADGQKVYVESCPQYFCMDESKYELPGFESAKFVLSPPLRRGDDITCLWNALKNDEIDTIGTDHCSFNFHVQKERGKDDFTKIPNGIPGVEHRPVFMYTAGVASGKITKEQMCAALSERPAKLFGLFPRKGVISVGSDADIVIWDPEQKGVISAKTQFQNVDYTPFEGFETKGAALTVFLRGKKVFDSGKIIAEKEGIYLKRTKSDL